MYRIRLNIYASAIFAGIILCNFSVSAAEIETTAGVGMEYTNNAALVSEDEDDDLVVIVGVGAKIDADSGPFNFTADTSFRNENYTQNTFSDEQYVSLEATAGWEMIKDRVDWTLQNFFSQQSINSFQPGTPNNTQDTNVLTFGTNIYFPISGRQSASLRPEYRKFTYDAQNVDNQQNTLNASWDYKMFRTMTVGLRGKTNKVDYDEPAISDIEFNSVGATVSGKRARSDFNLDLGVTHAEREDGTSSERGFSGSMAWLLNLAGDSNVRTYIASDLTNSSDRLLDAARNPEDGDFSNQQITSEILRNKIAKVTYTKEGITQSASVWGEFLDQDYEQSLLDQEVQSFGFEFDYSLTAVLSMSVSTRYERTDLKDLNRKYTQYNVGSTFDYRLSRKLRTVLGLRYQDRNSTLDTDEFSEYSVFVGLIYGYGTVTR